MKKHLKISHEVPLDYLGLSRAFNDYDYALAHLMDIPGYKEFYRESLAMGREVLLDNGACELGESFDVDAYAELVRDLRPTRFILPDKLNDKEATVRMHLEFLDKHPDLLQDSKAVGVMQGKCYEDLAWCYSQLAPRCDYIGVSFLSDAFDRGLGLDKMRPHFCEWLLQQPEYKACPRPMHLLGTYDAREFTAAVYEDKVFQSLDTSNPVTAAIEGWEYGDDGLRAKSPYPLCRNADTMKVAVDMELMIRNAKKFRALVKGEDAFTPLPAWAQRRAH